MGLIKQYRDKSFNKGVNPYHGLYDETGIYFDLLLLDENDTYDICDNEHEIAIVIIQGTGRIDHQGINYNYDRKDWIDHDPTVVHMAVNESSTLTASTKTRAAIVRTMNPNSFKGKVYTPDEIDTEHRGKGKLDDTCYRLVRLAFDDTIAPKEARLVIGEVLNFPGRWSSYPPHHHSQPEMYYYEFSPEWGYGHGELGEKVYKINNNDILIITDNKVHSQTSAPGFYMYYLWMIRHQKNNPYDGFTYIGSFENMLD